jgi:adenylate cyclase
VPLKVPTAKLVIKDILSGDGAKAELKEVYKALDEKNLQINLYKQKDTLKDEKINNLNTIIDKKDQQFALEREKSNSLLKELKVQKFKTAVYKAGSGIALVMTVLFLIK